jgi:hypothetical protein
VSLSGLTWVRGSWAVGREKVRKLEENVALVLDRYGWEVMFIGNQMCELV